MIVEVYIESGDMAKLEVEELDRKREDLGPNDFMEKVLNQINQIGYLWLPNDKDILAINSDKILFIKVLRDKEEQDNEDI